MEYPNPKESFSAYKLVMTRIDTLTEKMNSILKDNDPALIAELAEIEEQLMHNIQTMHYNLESMENMIMMRRNTQSIITDLVETTPVEKEAAGTQEVVSDPPIVQTEAEHIEPSISEPEVQTEESAEPTMKELLQEEEEEEQEETTTQKTESTRSQNQKRLNGETVYRFYRRLVNGHVFLDGIKTNTDSNAYFIPEKMIKDMGVEDGDYLAITASYQSNGMPRHKFEIREKGEEQEMDRLQYEYCLVHEDVSPIAESPFYVDNSYTKGSLMQYKDGEYTPIFRLYLQDSDIERLNIQADDIVTVAYWVNKPQESVRVIEVSELGETTKSDTKPSTKSSKKQTPKKQEADVDTTTYPNIVDKTVVVVGFEHFHARYEKVLASYGASTETLTGDEKTFNQFASVVDNADVVVFVVEMMSHHSYNEVKAYAKSKQVPHVIATKSGATFIAKMANDRLGDEA